MVTSYHKGYTCTGSTKIIHRYLLFEVSELSVFYLWLVLPFVRKAGLLQRRKRCSADATESHSPFLWPLSKDQSWLSARLSSVLRQESLRGSRYPWELRPIAMLLSPCLAAISPPSRRVGIRARLWDRRECGRSSDGT